MSDEVSYSQLAEIINAFGRLEKRLTKVEDKLTTVQDTLVTIIAPLMPPKHTKIPVLIGKLEEKLINECDNPVGEYLAMLDKIKKILEG